MEWNYMYDDREECYYIFFGNDADHIFKSARTEKEAQEICSTLKKEGWATNEYLRRKEEFKKLVYKELLKRPIIGYASLLEFSDDELKRFNSNVKSLL